MITSSHERAGVFELVPTALDLPARCLPGTTRQVLAADEPPFERKFLATEAQAAGVAEWAACHLAPDPHAAPASGGIYQVTSLYLDTERLDVYHRRGSYGRAKYRLRRYDEAPTLFLERKCKVKDRVRKRRTLVDPSALEWLAGAILPRDLPSRWFARRVEARGLAPICLVSYRRVANVGEGPYGTIRLTIDRDFLACPASGLQLPRVDDGVVLFPGEAVVELKYRVAMPALFKALVREHGLIPAQASKYRAAVEACGLQAVTREGRDA